MKMILLFVLIAACNKTPSNTSGVSAAHQDEQSKANTSQPRTDIPQDTTPRDQPGQ